MSQPPAKPVTAAPAPRWRKYVRRAGFAAAGLLILLAAAFFLLPVWISNEQGRLYVLDRLNDRLNGPRLAVEEWKLGWFRTTELKNLRITAPDGTTILTCPHVSSGLTLWDIFWSNYDLRNTTADRLELRIARNSDGTTSLDSFAGAADILRSARGALQVTSGQITVLSARTGQSLRYTDVKATVTVASPDAPFHVQITAIGEADATLSLAGTFPPTGTLSAANLAHPGAWVLLENLDVTANHVPTGLAGDFLGVDSAWVDSFGPKLDTVQFTGHPPPPTAGPASQKTLRLALLIRGGGSADDAPFIDARLLLHPPGAGSGGMAGGSLSVAGPDYRARAALRPSKPLAQLLGRLNPVLGETSPNPVGLIRADAANLMLPLDRPQDAEASLRLTFPPLVFTTRDGPSLLRQLQVALGDIPRPSARIEGAAEVLRVRLADGQFGYDNFLVSLGARQINFTGTVTLGGHLDLWALIPDARSGLAISLTRVVITGTTETPLVKRAE